MLVEATKDIHDRAFGHISSGKKLVVYAIERLDGKTYYYLLPLGIERHGNEYDPLWFESSGFRVLDDAVPDNWLTKNVDHANGKSSITSFPEWFQGEFYLRAHDWDLTGPDYVTVTRYKHEYESKYTNWLSA